MNSKCTYCEIPNRELNSKDYFDKMTLWRQYVQDDIMKYKGGDTPLENFEEIISREEKYVYYNYFECKCGKYIKTGVCIRSSTPIIEYISVFPTDIQTRN